MTRSLAIALSIAATAAAVLAVAAMATGTSDADDITIDLAPFVSTETADEVKASTSAGSRSWCPAKLPRHISC
jgi:hypothetical protein